MVNNNEQISSKRAKKNDVFQEFLRASGAIIACNIGLEYALVRPFTCYRDDFDVSVTFKSRLSCTKDEFLKQFKLKLV